MTTFPFTAICGQDELRRGLVLCAVDRQIGGLLALGDRGTGKSTTVRAFGQLLARAGVDSSVVTLPLGATEDRVIGSLDIEAALVRGEQRFSPGLLAEADLGFLYVDEINLLDDYLVDVLLDVAASGTNLVEREGISHSHPARFVLVGSGNPEEGELRPQLEDRFGLSCHVRTITDVATRAEIIRRRVAFNDDPEEFAAVFAESDKALAGEVIAARARLKDVAMGDDVIEFIVRLCVATGAVGHRGELVLASVSRAAAALAGRDHVTVDDVSANALLALRHRTPREAFDSPESIDARLRDVLGSLA